MPFIQQLCPEHLPCSKHSSGTRDITLNKADKESTVKKINLGTGIGWGKDEEVFLYGVMRGGLSEEAISEQSPE